MTNAFRVLLLVALVVGWRSPPATAQSTRLIPVERDVSIEVVDWGGSGRPVVLLAGLGASAQSLGDFAGRLSAEYHVYGITRRGFGGSSVPVTGYATDRLADDVIAVIDSIGLRRPVVAGHSFAGAELSSIGSRHPEKVSGLIYLDAGYPYAFYNVARGNYRIDVNEMRRRVEALSVVRDPTETRRLIDALLTTDIPAFERAIRERLAELPPPAPVAPGPPAPPRYIGVTPSPALDSIHQGQQRYTRVRAPVLAIYALPHSVPPFPPDDSASAAGYFRQQAEWPGQADAFERGIPGAKVVRIPHADHMVFQSNPEDVMREMRAFIRDLPPS
jgi:non-heme chloroperoxidase